ncbi:MAG TPA: sugar-binding domain-containing protein [Gemmatimonadaceae bacterium]|nr:sugar-binding domain-containing protein [Gemmatimonadaceae bacterium]
MPRVNIYIPDDLHQELRALRGDINISKVCATALRAELAGTREIHVAESMFSAIFRGQTWLELALLRRFPTLLGARAEIKQTKRHSFADAVADATTHFLNRTLVEGCFLGIGGGTHMWDVVRRLDSRDIGMHLWALGYGHVDQHAPHLHPNALVTMLSVRFAPRSKAHLVGAQRLDWAWHYPTTSPEEQGQVRRYIIGSCSMFDPQSVYATLLGKEMTDFLVEERVIGEYLGVFFTEDGRVLEPWAPSMTVSHVPTADLWNLAKRTDTSVALSVVGEHKVRLIQAVLEAGLCNTLITDIDTASVLAGVDKPRMDDPLP